MLLTAHVTMATGKKKNVSRKSERGKKRERDSNDSVHRLFASPSLFRLLLHSSTRDCSLSSPREREQRFRLSALVFSRRRRAGARGYSEREGGKTNPLVLRPDVFFPLVFLSMPLPLNAFFFLLRNALPLYLAALRCSSRHCSESLLAGLDETLLLQRGRTALTKRERGVFFSLFFLRTIDLADRFFVLRLITLLLSLLFPLYLPPKTVQDRAVQAPGDDGPELRW